MEGVGSRGPECEPEAEWCESFGEVVHALTGLQLPVRL